MPVCVLGSHTRMHVVRCFQPRVIIKVGQDTSSGAVALRHVWRMLTVLSCLRSASCGMDGQWWVVGLGLRVCQVEAMVYVLALPAGEGRRWAAR